MSDSIHEAWQAGLDVLRPAPKDLEHGRELHAQAVVVDAYGFAPRAAVDGAALRTAVEAGASEREFQDLNEEMRMTRCATDAAEREEFRGAWEAAGVTCIFQNAGEEGQAVRRLLKRLARFTYVTDRLPDLLVRAVKPEDIVRAKHSGRHCLYLTGNGVPLAEEWVSVEEELGYIRIFFQLGVRMMHMTYNRRNMIGDGCMEAANGGLSDFGRAVVREMNRVGVIVDVAHSGWNTCLDAARASERPIVASHSGAYTLNPHRRCKTDEVLRAIAASDGLVGVCCVPGFLGGAGDLSALLDHIAYLARLIGCDHVAIGTDAAYSSSRAGTEARKVPERGTTRPRWSGFWLPDEPVFAPQWNQPRQKASLAWTNWPLYTVGLVQRGFSDEEILKILGGNVLRVARAVLPTWD